MLELGQGPSEVSLGNLGEFGKCTCQHTSAERRVGYDGDVELGTGFCDTVVQDVCREEGEFDFDGGDGVDFGSVVVS